MAWLAREAARSADDPAFPRAAACTGGLPVHRSEESVLAVRPDGSVWGCDPDGGNAYPVRETLWVTTARVRAARAHPELTALRPARTADAVDCPFCAGSGQLSAEFDCRACMGRSAGCWARVDAACAHAAWLRGSHARSHTVAPPARGSYARAMAETLICRGDLFWWAEPAADGAAAPYAHPHVVLQDDLFNRSRITTVVVCALTTNLHIAHEPGNVLLELGEGGLPKRSAVVVTQIASVQKAQLGARIGALSPARVEQILAGLRFVQRSYFGR